MEHSLNMSSKLSREHSAREGTFLITHSVNFCCHFFFWRLILVWQFYFTTFPHLILGSSPISRDFHGGTYFNRLLEGKFQNGFASEIPSKGFWKQIYAPKKSFLMESPWHVLRGKPKFIWEPVQIGTCFRPYLILSGVPICLAEFSAGQIGIRRTQKGIDSHTRTWRASNWPRNWYVFFLTPAPMYINLEKDKNRRQAITVLN